MKLKVFGTAALILLAAAKTDLFGTHSALAGLAAFCVLATLLWQALPGGKQPAPAGHHRDNAQKAATASVPAPVSASAGGGGACRFCGTYSGAVTAHEAGHVVAARAGIQGSRGDRA